MELEPIQCFAFNIFNNIIMRICFAVNRESSIGLVLVLWLFFLTEGTALGFISDRVFVSKQSLISFFLCFFLCFFSRRSRNFKRFCLKRGFVTLMICILKVDKTMKAYLGFPQVMSHEIWD